MPAYPEFDLTGAVQYHYGKFPPKSLDTGQLIKPVAKAAAALARYDQMLKGMHNSEILLGPLRNQEAVFSSRIEGTITTLDEVLRYEADQEGNAEKPEIRHRNDTIETFLYARALRTAQQQMAKGQPLSSFLLRSAHKILMGLGRGAAESPGEYKSEQNYLADRRAKKILFIPISPEQLLPGIERLFNFVTDESWEDLIKTALCHVEFEALHPFKDGNGRIGRMLITLMLWQQKLISQPYFYISSFFDRHRDEYIDRMRAVSADDAWTEWTLFFLDALAQQAEINLAKAEEIKTLYDKLKREFQETLASQWAISALDFFYARPIFRNTVFIAKSGIPKPTAYRFVKLLSDNGSLKTLVPSSGRRPALYSFEPLLEIIRERT